MSTFLSTQSRKAWVAGVATALLQPVLNLLSGQNVLTLRTLLIAVISGVLGAVAVWATENVDNPVATPATPAQVPATAAELPRAIYPVAGAASTNTSMVHAIPPVPTLDVAATEDFGGQSVHD